MIEPTDEMIYAFAGEPEVTGTDAHAIRVGLAAVLAIVERDYRTEPRSTGVTPRWRCNTTERCFREDGHDGRHAFAGETSS